MKVPEKHSRTKGDYNPPLSKAEKELAKKVLPKELQANVNRASTKKRRPSA